MPTELLKLSARKLILLFLFVTGYVSGIEIEKVNTSRQITGRFQRQESWFVLQESERTYLFGWPPYGYAKAPALKKKQVYTFTLQEMEIVRTKYRTNVLTFVTQIQKDGQTIFDYEMCELHRTKMVREEVPIVYGLWVPGPKQNSVPSSWTKTRSFPHRTFEWIGGGCVVQPETTRKILVCQECNTAYEAWKQKRQKVKK